MAKTFCCKVGCYKMRVPHNSMCREHLNEYMRDWREKKRADEERLGYHHQKPSHRKGGDRK